ncbi:MAG: flagellar export chaperone FlgN [Phycisphaerales bacterium]|nr:MAG: flagellar export chaperone FlgN [Phycisphaerales bacterium]
MTTATDSVDTPQEVLSLLREEAALYGKLESCASRQRSLMTREDLSALLALLEERKALSADLTRIGGRLAPIKRNWCEHRGMLTASERAEADKLVADITDSLRRAIETDAEDVRLLQARKQSVAQALCATHSKGTAISAYRVPSAALSRIDHLHEGS